MVDAVALIHLAYRLGPDLMTDQPFDLPRYRSGDAEIDAALADAVASFGDHHDPELVFEMMASVARMARNGTVRRDLKLVNSAVKELRYAMETFAPYEDRRKVSIFGSARTPADSPEYSSAREFGEAMVQQGWMAITGAGPGIMTAGIEGAGPANSFGVNILLPFESGEPPGMAGDPKLINFRYFFTRKLMFMKESHGYALFPGGFGTLDETFELLTLMQTGRTYLAPVVLLDAGSTYWESWSDFVHRELGDRNLISMADLELARICHTTEQATEEICAFYRRYHSMRFVGKRLVLRLTEALTPAEIAELAAEFDDIVETGSIEAIDTTESETADDDVIDLPRLAFAFDKRSYGRLRLLIDRINHHERSPDAVI